MPTRTHSTPHPGLAGPLLVALLVGCASPSAPLDAGLPTDAPTRADTAPSADHTALDAPAADAPSPTDAPVRSDVAPATDAPATDAWVPRALVPSGPLTLNGDTDRVIEGLHITSTTGDCVVLTNTARVTIRASEIGPCAGNAVVVAGGSAVTLADNYIHPEHPPTHCCDTGDGVFAHGVTGLTVRGNVIAYGEANIEVSGSMHVQVLGNFLLNPQNGGSRGQNFQAWSGCSDVTVSGNYALSSSDPRYTLPGHQEDSINFGITTGIVARDNYVVGGTSASGCGIIADDQASSVVFANNRLIDTGQCGISIADGTNQSVTGNRILNRTPVAGGGNTALVVWKQYTTACGPVTVQGNVASEVKPDGHTESGYWNGGGCEPVTATGNTWDAAARAMLAADPTFMAPPSIPPMPELCVAPSPLANNTTLPSCAAAH